jgi:hypothetical protein
VTNINDIIDAIPVQPAGNIDNEVAPRLRVLTSVPISNLSHLHELNGLVGRAIYLAQQRPTSGDSFPTGGAPAAMRQAA